MSIWKWSSGIEQVSLGNQMTLGEGDTPLIRSRRLGPKLGLENLYFKLETMNPSGSYKDRFAVSAIAHMLEDGQSRCIATSSGNTGAALAAYCAAAGIRCEIAVVETAPIGKLQQMLAYGADVYRVKGFGTDPIVTDAVFSDLQKQAEAPDAALQVSAFKYSPKGMSGVRSLGYELMGQLAGDTNRTHIYCPAGGGGLAVAVAEAYIEKQGSAHVHCVQPEGNNTISGPLAAGEDQAQAVDCTSRISGLQVASVVDGNETIATCRQTQGTGILVNDEDTWEIQKQLALLEGVFAEPAGSIAVAAAVQSVKQGIANASDNLVCLVTGSGFKDPASVDRMNAGRDVSLRG